MMRTSYEPTTFYFHRVAPHIPSFSCNYLIDNCYSVSFVNMSQRSSIPMELLVRLWSVACSRQNAISYLVLIGFLSQRERRPCRGQPVNPKLFLGLISLCYAHCIWLNFSCAVLSLFYELQAIYFALLDRFYSHESFLSSTWRATFRKTLSWRHMKCRCVTTVFRKSGYAPHDRAHYRIRI